MDTLALKTRAIAQVQVLAQAWEMLQQTWSEIQAIGDERRDVLDRMLCDHYPFNESFDDLAIEVADWCKAITSYDIKPEPVAAEDAGKTYLFVDGLYQGEFDGSNDAAMRACELMGIDKGEVMNSGEGWADYICNLHDNNNQDVEIIHETDYRFYQGNNHPANRMELKEYWKEFVPAFFSIDGGKEYEGVHRPNVRWNGWACPYFTFETANTLLTELEIPFKYNEERDMFEVEDQSYPEEGPDQYEGLLFDGVKRYAIGAWGWVWDARKNRRPVEQDEEEMQPEQPAMDYNAKFPNGFTSWYETHHEVVCAMVAADNVKGSMIQLQHEAGGTGRMYEIAEELTDKFEKEHAGETWEEKDYYDTIWAFCQDHMIGAI